MTPNKALGVNPVRFSWALILTIAMIAVSQASNACMCVPKPDIEEQFENYSEIFLGAIIDVLPIAAGKGENGAQGFRVMTKVVEIYKGDPPETISGYTNQDPTETYTSSCGPGYEVGHFYIIFRRFEASAVASNSKMPPETNRRYSRPFFSSCSHTVWPVTDEALEYLRSEKGLER